MKNKITKIEKEIETIMSVFDNVRINVEPKRVVHTSPERFAGGEKIFIIKYPNANAPTEIIATLASPFIFELSFVHRIKIAHKTVTGRTKRVLFVSFRTEATAIAPKAVWESPSPIYENRLRTRVTPSKEEARAIIVPVKKA